MAIEFDSINNFESFVKESKCDHHHECRPCPPEPCPPTPPCPPVPLPRKGKLTVYAILGTCPDGEPIENMPIELYRLDGCIAPGLELAGCGFTDENGKVVFKCLDDGEYAVRAVVDSECLQCNYYPGFRVRICQAKLNDTVTILCDFVGHNPHELNHRCGKNYGFANGRCCKGSYNSGCGCDCGYSCGSCGCN